MNNYNDIVNFPSGLTNWPSLTDNRNSSTVTTDQIVWAEHYNKLANFIDKVETHLSYYGTVQASGANISPDHSVKTIYRGLAMSNTTSAMLKIVAPKSYYLGPTDTTQQVQNVIPFEFVFTTNPDNIANMIPTNGASPAGYSYQLFSDTLPNSKPTSEFSGILSATNIYATATYTSTRTNGLSTVLPSSQLPHLNLHTIRLSDTIIVRGFYALDFDYIFNNVLINITLWGAS